MSVPLYMSLNYANPDLQDGPGSLKEGTWSELVRPLLPEGDPRGQQLFVRLYVVGEVLYFPVASKEHGLRVLDALRSGTREVFNADAGQPG